MTVHRPCDITSVRIMRYSVPLWVASTLVVFATLVLLSYVTALVLYVGAAAIAGFLSDQLIKLAVNLAPRRLLPGLRERAVFITGCSSGFGLQLAKRLDAIGVTVYAGLRKPHSTGALELKATCSNNLHIVVIDVTKDEDVENAVKYVNKTIGDKVKYVNKSIRNKGMAASLGKIRRQEYQGQRSSGTKVGQRHLVKYVDKSIRGRVFWAVVNNAGVSALGDVELTPFSVFSHLMETNALGCVRVTKAFLPLLRESKGRVVCVGSISGLFAFPGLTHYAMSKHALTAFADGLRRELRKWSVGVHVVDPHMYQTGMTNEMSSIKRLKENWETCSEKTLTDYGPDFFKKYTENARYIARLSRGSLAVPLDDIMDAILGETPQVVADAYFGGLCDFVVLRLGDGVCFVSTEFKYFVKVEVRFVDQGDVHCVRFEEVLKFLCLLKSAVRTLVVVSPGIVPRLQDIAWYPMASKRVSSLIQGESTQLPNPNARHKDVEPIDAALCTICSKISM
uniref:Uncharacterized protein n=1 Tax=Timema cristinae TaxID=61476 RepID=A0A7R9H716_TIMCR|nr:unnamed protein product [Timema cristinae]